jgi:hypothetical protein
MSIELQTPEVGLDLQDGEKGDERLKNIEGNRMPSLQRIMMLTSDYDTLGYAKSAIC